MTREEMINILKLLSTIEGFVIGKVGAFSLPDYVQEVSPIQLIRLILQDRLMT